MSEKKEDFLKEIEMAKFDSKRDIKECEKRGIETNLRMLRRKAAKSGNPLCWEDYAINAMYKKVLFPNEKEAIFNEKTYNAVEEASMEHFHRGNLDRYLHLTASKKILFPEKWNTSETGRDFHYSDMIWKIMHENLEYINPEDEWDNIYPFFNFAQDMKIVAPRRFEEEIDLQKMLGENIWIQDIQDELEGSTHCYSNFTLLASPIQVVGYPGKIDIDALEWAEMQEEGEEIVKYGDILHFAEYSARRNILSAKDIKITDESFDLIF